MNRIITMAATCALALAILAPVAGSQGAYPSPSPGQSNADTVGQGASGSTGTIMDSTRTSTTTTTTTKHARHANGASTKTTKTRHATTHHRKTTSASTRVNATTPHSTHASGGTRVSSDRSTRNTGSTTRRRARGAGAGAVPDEGRPNSPGVEGQTPPANADSIYGPPMPESGTMESRNPDQREGSSAARGNERSVPVGGDSRIELNTATREEIAMLPGLSVTVADKVIAARPFSSWNELLAKGILTPRDVARIQNHVTVNGQPVQARVDLNTATREELAMLPGLDYPTADKIIAARPFNSPTDLVNRNILNRSQWDRISDRVAVGAAGVENNGTIPDTGTSTPH